MKIEQKQEQLQQLREAALTCGGFDYSKERVQTSNTGGQIEEPVLRYIALEQEINLDTRALQDVIDTVTNGIHQLDNAKHIRVLFKRYVECKSLRKISKEMEYSYDRIRHIHGDALRNFEKIIKK